MSCNRAEEPMLSIFMELSIHVKLDDVALTEDLSNYVFDNLNDS